MTFCCQLGPWCGCQRRAEGCICGGRWDHSVRSLGFLWTTSAPWPSSEWRCDLPFWRRNPARPLACVLSAFHLAQVSVEHHFGSGLEGLIPSPQDESDTQGLSRIVLWGPEPLPIAHLMVRWATNAQPEGSSTGLTECSWNRCLLWTSSQPDYLEGFCRNRGSP